MRHLKKKPVCEDSSALAKCGYESVISIHFHRKTMHVIDCGIPRIGVISLLNKISLMIWKLFLDYFSLNMKALLLQNPGNYLPVDIV